jgi:Kef-type K+ transport system membrane component KefB
MYEKQRQPLLRYSKFLWRLGRALIIGFILIAIALWIGMYGYHRFEKMSWVDSFANASMILSGMGPFGPLTTEAGKIFAGCYALFSGLTFIIVIATILAPVIHRFLHKFHLENKND